MKTLKLITFLILASGLIQACKILKSTKESNERHLTVFQNGKEYTIDSPSESIEIEKSEFSLRFYNKRYDSENKKFYSAQIAVFKDKFEFDKIKIGLSKTNTPCFKLGSGMAPDRSGKYESLIFNNSGHHYTTYENSDSKRLNLLEESNGLLKLEFEINALYYDSKEINMAETELKEFYLAFLIDENLNGTIDKGELKKLTIKLK